MSNTLQRVLRLSPKRVLKKANDVRALRSQAQDADAFMSSYIKSGRTWLRYIFSHYINETRDLGIEMDLVTMFKVVPNFATDDLRGFPAFKAQQFNDDVPLVLVTHRLYNPFLFGKRPIIFLVREPRDVMVSAFFHAVHHKKTFDGDMDQFLIDDQYGLPAFIRFHNEWAPTLKSLPSVTIRYEDLQEDTAAACRKVFSYLNWEIDEAALARAIELSSFEQMQKVEVRVGIPGHDYDRNDENSRRARKGIVGGYKSELTSAQSKLVEQKLIEDLSPEALDHFGFAEYFTETCEPE